MPVKRTSGYKLSQWEKSDKVLMDDFNTDNLNIENALAGLETSKAKQTDLAALQTTVGTKANQSDLNTLKTEVAAKATTAALTNLQNTVTQLNATLAAAQASIPKIKVGTYAGDGAASRTINVGFTPVAVFVCDNNGGTCFYNSTGRFAYRGGLAVTGGPVTTGAYNGNALTVLAITTNGFTVSNDSMSTSGSPISATSNSTSYTYHYIAIG